jgi:single-strand DNA-binding protein
MAKEIYKNEVSLTGRVGKSIIERELPSGDRVVELRMIIERDDREGFDTFEISVWKSALRRRTLALNPGQWIKVEGVLRRRFWRAGPNIASRWQVEARELNKV